MMTRRFTQILGLLLNMLGLVLVGCTLALDHWRVAQVGGQGGSSVVVTASFRSDLWKDCYEDSTAVINCVDFGVLWKVKPDIQAVRGLLISGLCLGLIGTVLIFLGMECTSIGDTESNRTVLTAACLVNLLSGVSAVAGYCLYINRVVAAFLHSKADPLQLSYRMGPALYIGLVGSFLIILATVINWLTIWFSPKRRYTEHFVSPKNHNRGLKEQQDIYKYDSSRCSSYKIDDAVVV